MNLYTFLCGIVVPFVASILLVFWIHPHIVKIALDHDLTDNPNARKLQKKPVPVMGGIAVFWGIVAGTSITSILFDSYALFTASIAIMVMLYVGTIDDIKGLSPQIRLFLEIIAVLFIISMDSVSINDFQGILGIGRLPWFLAVPLTLFAGAGIINSINMIDGVDGLSTGFCIVACAIFAYFFASSFDGTMAVLACLTAGSLIPFILHNIFGDKSKMFVGDGGTMMMGMVMTIFCMHLINHGSRVSLNYPNVSTIALCLSILSVPIFDTLRVMTARILRGINPFHPDKSHLHHLFIEIGFSHAGTTLGVIILDLINVFCWAVSCHVLNWGPTAQFMVVFCIGVFNTTGIYFIVRRMNHRHVFYRTLRRLAIISHIERDGFFKRFRQWIDER